MQDSCPQSDFWPAAIGNLAGDMPFTSSAGLLDREVTPTIIPTVVRAKGCAEWDRRDERGCSGKASAKQGCLRGACVSPARGFPLPVPSCPAHTYAWSCPCQELLLCPHVSSLPVLTDPISVPVCPALPCNLSVCAGVNEQVPQTLMRLGR